MSSWRSVNSGAKLPRQDIVVVHNRWMRMEPHYFLQLPTSSKVSSEWKHKAGNNTNGRSLPTPGIGGKETRVCQAGKKLPCLWLCGIDLRPYKTKCLNADVKKPQERVRATDYYSVTCCAVNRRIPDDFFRFLDDKLAWERWPIRFAGSKPCLPIV